MTLFQNKTHTIRDSVKHFKKHENGPLRTPALSSVQLTQYTEIYLNSVFAQVVFLSLSKFNIKLSRHDVAY